MSGGPLREGQRPIWALVNISGKPKGHGSSVGFSRGHVKPHAHPTYGPTIVDTDGSSNDIAGSFDQGPPRE